MSKHIIEVKGLEKQYKNSQEKAVDGVSFYVEEGSFFSLLGPNGAGKTTTISILTTTLSATGGQAVIAGHDLIKQPDKVRQEVGVIFQNPSLDLNLTAEENVRFHVNLYGLYAYRPTFGLMDGKYQKEVNKLADLLGIGEALHKPVKTLSGGMKRKLEIIRSLMHRPKVLFLDEPTTGLDPISRRSLWNYLMDLKAKTKITIFLTTHYLEEAEASDYICIINRGKIVSKGTPGEIKAELVENYVEIETDHKDKLVREIRKKGWEFEDKGEVRVFLNGLAAVKVIQSLKTPIKSVDIYKPSLEQAYLKIIEDEETN